MTSFARFNDLGKLSQSYINYCKEESTQSKEYYYKLFELMFPDIECIPDEITYDTRQRLFKILNKYKFKYENRNTSEDDITHLEYILVYNRMICGNVL